MNVLSKKMIIFGIVLFLAQNVCAMWQGGSRDQEIYSEEYFQELERLNEQYEEENQETRHQPNPAIAEAMKNPQEYREPQEYKKSNGKTLPRTSRKNFKRSNVERK